MKKIYFFFLVFMLVLMGCADTAQVKVENTPLHFYQEENGNMVEYKLYTDYVESINNPVDSKTKSFPYVDRRCKAAYILILTNYRELKIPTDLKSSGALYQINVNTFTVGLYVGNWLKKGEKGLKITYMFEDNNQKYYFTETLN